MPSTTPLFAIERAGRTFVITLQSPADQAEDAARLAEAVVTSLR